ncbi:VWA N-terminal, partial [Trinorchestia longiramus]
DSSVSGADNSSDLVADNTTYVVEEPQIRCNISSAPDLVMGGLQTSRTSYGVHIPVEVYHGYPEIVNGVLWSECVDSVFKSNAEEDKTISWQYFAAAAGYMRYYPSTEWPVPPELFGADLYDGRRRQWYTRGSTLPKDIVILMDRSGSMHGQTFSIMKFSVKTLINTLGEDDFVNVAVFNNTVSWVLNCSDSSSSPSPS